MVNHHEIVSLWFPVSCGMFAVQTLAQDCPSLNLSLVAYQLHDFGQVNLALLCLCFLIFKMEKQVVTLLTLLTDDDELIAQI